MPGGRRRGRSVRLFDGEGQRREEIQQAGGQHHATATESACVMAGPEDDVDIGRLRWRSGPRVPGTSQRLARELDVLGDGAARALPP